MQYRDIQNDIGTSEATAAKERKTNVIKNQEEKDITKHSQKGWGNSVKKQESRLDSLLDTS